MAGAVVLAHIPAVLAVLAVAPLARQIAQLLCQLQLTLVAVVVVVVLLTVRHLVAMVVQVSWLFDILVLSVAQAAQLHQQVVTHTTPSHHPAFI